MMFYQCKPDDLYELLGAGVRLIDEVHEDFHFNFKQDLYTHIETTWSLTATLKSDNMTTDKMYHVVFNSQAKMPEIEYNRYAHVTALMYGLNDQKAIRTTQRGSFMYSHTAFEESIMKSPKLLERYLFMIRSIVYEIYITKMKPGQKLLVFAATVAMCEKIQKDLSAAYEVSVSKYTAEDDYSVLQKSDISVSTLGSAGTGVDVPDLCYVLMTNSIKSIQSNLQAFGRLRDIRSEWPDTELQFYYLVCRDIPKHLEYDHRKREIFNNKTLGHRSMDTPHRL
jgi:superfamily II DNA or RNA helicase